MILWFIQHFKIEMLVFTICVAVTIGLVVQRLPQAAIPQPRTISRYAECAKQMEEYRVWFEKVYAPPGQNWYEGWEKYQQWVRYCKEAMPNWTVPEVVEQASKAAQTRINTRQAAAPAQQVHQPTQTIQQKMESEPPRKERPLQELQTECRTKFALLKEWYDRYHTHANADLVQFHQNWQKGIEFCTKNIAGWSLPAEFAIPMESSSSPQQVSTPQPTVTPLKQQCDAGIAELEKWYRSLGWSPPELLAKGEATLQGWIQQCQHYAGWTVPQSLYDVKADADRKKVTSTPQQECNAKMDEFRIWLEKFDTRGSSAKEQWATQRTLMQQWAKQCSPLANWVFPHATYQALSRVEQQMASQ